MYKVVEQRGKLVVKTVLSTTGEVVLTKRLQSFPEKKPS